MDLYYAVGGGLGHLTRARAFLHTLGIERNSAILTASGYSCDKRITENIQIIKLSESYARDKFAYSNFLFDTIQKHQPANFYIDSFPAGILGEFSNFDFGRTNVIYIARLLKWACYAPLLKKNYRADFKTTFVLETLSGGHYDFVKKNSRSIEKIKLIYPTAATIPENAGKILNDIKPFWLIVHSGDMSEKTELVRYADDMRNIERADVILVLASPERIEIDIPDLIQADIYPAAMLFVSAGRIFTACGFNAMNQLEIFREKHFFLPFERRFDDQFERAARHRKI